MTVNSGQESTPACHITITPVWRHTIKILLSMEWYVSGLKYVYTASRVQKSPKINVKNNQEEFA